MNCAPQAPHEQKILIIEDDPVAAKVYGQYLAKEGYQVMLAADGPSGLQKLSQLGTHGVLLDIMLPGVSGIEVLKQIRATQPELPVIVYTNGFVPLLVDKALAAGASEVYNKISLTSYELTQAFAKYLRRKAA
jgi:CheY-like chemotaxis protein